MRIWNRERRAAALKWNFTYGEVTNHAELKGKKYRAVTKVKGLSVEKLHILEADTVHKVAGRSFKIDKARF
ncbi:MAG TPA: hypothetical protein ENN18_09170 [Proteobacteria bacterium]|nr:hypothetical protein [Pseudomonadota bacterium]